MKYIEQFLDADFPRQPLIEKAFAAAYERVMLGDSLQQASDQIRQRINFSYDADAERMQKSMLADEYARQEQNLQKERQYALDRVTEIATDALYRDFKKICIEGPAREIINHSASELEVYAGDKNDSAGVILLAAAILLPTVLNEKDEKRILKDFGPAVGGLIKTLRHIEDDPDAEFYDPVLDKDLIGQKDPDAIRERLAEADQLVKTLYLAQMITALVREMNDGDLGDPDYTKESDTVSFAQAAKGANPELDTRFRAIFNGVAEMKRSSFRVQENRIGELDLVDISQYQPQKIQPKIQPKPEKEVQVMEAEAPEEKPKPLTGFNPN